MTISSLPVNIIFCPRSGMPLAKVEALCSHGWPLLNSLSNTANGLIHPIYGMPLEKLIIKLRNDLNSAELIGWCSIEADQKEIQLTVSAIMYSLQSIWTPPVEAHHLWSKMEPSLPGWPVCVASARRLLTLAGWFHFATSKRLTFPRYRVSRANNNLFWENFSSWLDEAFEIKTQWEKGKDALQDAETFKLRTEALTTVRAESVYKRIDFVKVWNWIEIQLQQDARYPAGRRATFKTLFMSADLHPEDWILDDVEDVQVAVLECCDAGNEIMFFIRKRLQHIHAIIQDFYSSFTILANVKREMIGQLDDVTAKEAEATNAFFEKFDNRISNLTELPAEPKRESFDSLGKFLKAQAEWRILSKRFTAKAVPPQVNIEGN